MHVRVSQTALRLLALVLCPALYVYAVPGLSSSWLPGPGIDETVLVLDGLPDLTEFLQRHSEFVNAPRGRRAKRHGYAGFSAPIPGAVVELFLTLAGERIRKAFPHHARLVHAAAATGFVGVVCADPALRAPIANIPHIDGTGNGLAVVWYLRDEGSGDIGTGFFRHRATNLTQISSELDYKRIKDSVRDNEADQFSRRPLGYLQPHGETDFECLARSRFLPNRAVVYPKTLLHSAILVPRGWDGKQPGVTKPCGPVCRGAAPLWARAKSQKEICLKQDFVHHLSCDAKGGRLSISLFFGEPPATVRWPLNPKDALTAYSAAPAVPPILLRYLVPSREGRFLTGSEAILCKFYSAELRTYRMLNHHRTSCSSFCSTLYPEKKAESKPWEKPASLNWQCEAACETSPTSCTCLANAMEASYCNDEQRGNKLCRCSANSETPPTDSARANKLVDENSTNEVSETCDTPGTCASHSTAAYCRTLKVIGAGFGRTGTTSLAAALSRLLDGETYRMYSAVLHAATHFDMWLNTTEPDFAGIFGSMNGAKPLVAAVDFPVAVHYAALMELCPNTRVILTVRNDTAWLKSFRWLLESQIFPSCGENKKLCQDYMPWLMRSFFGLGPSWDWSVGGNFDGDTAIAAFNAWNKKVIETVPPERLLVIDLTQSRDNKSEGRWEQLCVFIGCKSVPSEPFPVKNHNDGS